MPTLDQRIEQETAKVKADSYQTVASLGGWRGGARTFFAFSIVAGAMGAVMGLVAPFFPLLALGFTATGIATAVGAIPASMAVFAATGMSLGFAGGLMLGRISGVGATVAEEQEKRLKEWMVRQKIAENPNAEILPDTQPIPEPQKSLGQRIKDTYRTYFNPRVGLILAAICAVAGLVMSAAFIATSGGVGAVIAAPLATMTGLSAETFAVGSTAFNAGALVAYTTGVMATMGALFTVNIPKIASHMTHFFGELLSGKPLGREWKPKESAKTISATSQNERLADEAVAKTRFAEKERQAASYQDLAKANPASTHLGI